MEIEAIRCTPENGGRDWECRRIDPANLRSEKWRAANLPLAYIVDGNDLSRFRDLPDVFTDAGRKDPRKQLSAYLGGRSKIPYIDGNYKHAGQSIRGIRGLLEYAQRHDANIYVIGLDHDLFKALSARITQRVPDAKRRMAPHRDADPVAATPERSLLHDLLPEYEVPAQLRRDFVGESEDIRFLRRLIIRAATQTAPVLLLGETGSGKDAIATAIHRHGPRAGKPFVPVNCGAIPSELFETELFGYKKDAHSRAMRDKPGLWKQADGGTLFLDEIAELPKHHQVKILRALDDGIVWPLGATRGEQVDVRIVAATNRDLAAMVAAGRFREDLYYRLRAFMIHTIPLRRHPDDIPMLARHLWKGIAGNNARLSDEIVGLLQAYNWPGNVRDLKLTLDGLFSFFGQDSLRKDHLDAIMQLQGQGGPHPAGPLSSWEFDLYQTECLRHLRQAGDAIQAARMTLLPAVKQPIDPSAIRAVVPSINNFISEFERFCMRPLAFHDESVFETMQCLNKQLRYFGALLPDNARDAIRFWKSEMKPQFKRAQSAVFTEVGKLTGRTTGGGRRHKR